ncbi:rwd domain-containing protein [Linderina macrospora]|uniref:Rwd domain-containing protein n=1 Tax=Linderina macrospora TaxID=4868 RepID=A0ACC1J349_9FUNG|nr:rwd domain-containing protein [Linderina macrospora]
MADEHYLEEQRSEVEILQSIYPEEFTELAEDPYTFSIEIALDDDELPASTVLLTVEYTATYPDELPTFDLTVAEADEDSDDENAAEPEAVLDESDMEDIKEKTRAVGEESLGMAMVFTMAMQVKELMAERLSEKLAEVRRKEDERIQKEIEADQAKFVGTQVTRASFLEWKDKFDRERAELEAKRAALAAGDSRGASKRTAESKKLVEMGLTGRQLFEQDRSLAQSDSKFISEGDVAVDSSLFVDEDLSDDDESDEE